MANVQRVKHEFKPSTRHPVKGSVEAIEVGDLVYQDSRFQGNTSQNTVRPASSGSAGANAGDGRFQFAENFSGVARQRHDLNSFDKEIAVNMNCEAEYTIYNNAGAATAVTADFDVGTLIAVAVTAAFVPIDQGVVIDGHGSTTVAANQAIGRLSRPCKNGDSTAWCHLVSPQVGESVV